MDLLDLLRENDLPPRWDGCAVLWRGWETQAPIFICPPPKPECCAGCGSLAERVFNMGLTGVLPHLSHDDLRYEEENRARLGVLAHKRKPRALLRLRAYRCPDCKLDEVWDTHTDEWWTLDHTDYGDAGSA